MKDVTDAKITDYLKTSRKRAVDRENDPNKTANRDLREINALFNWALHQKQFAGQIAGNPCRYVQAFPEEEAVRYVPPAEDIQKVLLAATPWEMDIITVLLHTGARIGEVRNLLWDDLSMTLRRFEAGAGPEDSGSNSNDLAGASRVGPLVFALARDPQALDAAALAQTRLTHNHAGPGGRISQLPAFSGRGSSRSRPGGRFGCAGTRHCRTGRACRSGPGSTRAQPHGTDPGEWL